MFRRRRGGRGFRLGDERNVRVEICGVNDGLLRDFICKLGPEAWIYQIRSNRIGERNNRTKKTQNRDGGSKVGEGDGICKLGDFTGPKAFFCLWEGWGMR